MGRININKNIEIERNFIEKSLIKIKDFIKSKSSLFLYFLIGLGVICIITVGGLWMYHNYKAKQLVKFEIIMENYDKNSKKDKDAGKKAIGELKELSVSWNPGFVKEMIFYTLGNLHYIEKQYKEAIEYLTRFSEFTRPSVFTSTALLKAALAREQLNDLKGAIDIYRKLETAESNSEVIDQILFNLARVMMKDNNPEESRKYYNRIIILHPNSVYAEKAKKRLLLAGLKSK